MIDEDLYKIATDELNSGARKPDVWARACALASDDHDEARFLYTNLRVEEMLNKDGKQRTFSTGGQHREVNVNNAAPIDVIEIDQAASFGSEPMDSRDTNAGSTNPGSSSATQIDSSNARVDTVNVSPSTDEPDSYKLAESNSQTTSSGTDVLSDKVVELDDETMAELAALSGDSSNDSNTVASIAEMSAEKSRNDDQTNENAVDPKNAVANVFGASAAANREHVLSQDQRSTPAVVSAPAPMSKHDSSSTNVDASNIYSNSVSDIEDLDATSDTAYADATLADPAAFAANDDAAPEHQDVQRQIQQELRQQAPTDQQTTTTIVRTDHVGSDQLVDEDASDSDHLIDEDVSIGTTSALDTGVGRAFMVFNRHGNLKGIKRGVSWPALFFTFPWLLSKALFGTAILYGCLWLVSLGGLLVSVNRWIVAGANASIDIKLWAGAFAILVIVGLLYIPFRYGNRWVAEKLQKRGFRYEGSVSAENKLDAIDRLLEYNKHIKSTEKPDFTS